MPNLPTIATTQSTLWFHLPTSTKAFFLGSSGPWLPFWRQKGVILAFLAFTKIRSIILGRPTADQCPSNRTVLKFRWLIKILSGDGRVNRRCICMCVRGHRIDFMDIFRRLLALGEDGVDGVDTRIAIFLESTASTSLSCKIDNPGGCTAFCNDWTPESYFKFIFGNRF